MLPMCSISHGTDARALARMARSSRKAFRHSGEYSASHDGVSPKSEFCRRRS